MAPVKKERSVKAEHNQDTKPYIKNSSAGKKRTAWSAEEEAIWNSLIVKTLKAHMLSIVRADGRIKDRCIATHLSATIRNIEKNGRL